MQSSAISSTAASSASTGGVAAVATKELGKNEFLKLLLAQLANQDPTKPVDNQAFVAQLAQFSSVEALENMGGKLDTISMAQANANQLAVPQMIGKEVLYQSSQLSVAAGQPATFSVGLGGDAAAMTATIQDATGKVVKTIPVGARAAGANTVTWDGTDARGNPVAAGSYFVTVAATSASGGAVAATTSVRGVVTGVSFDGSVPQLLVNGTTVKLADVTQISAAPSGG